MNQRNVRHEVRRAVKKPAGRGKRKLNKKFVAAIAFAAVLIVVAIVAIACSGSSALTGNIKLSSADDHTVKFESGRYTLEANAGEEVIIRANVSPKDLEDRVVTAQVENESVVSIKETDAPEEAEATQSSITYTYFKISVLDEGQTDILFSNSNVKNPVRLTVAAGNEIIPETVPDTDEEDIPCEKISLNLDLGKDDFLTVGNEEKFSVKFSPEDTTDTEIIWSSSDEEIAKVSESGVVTAVAPGEVEITASLRRSEIEATYKLTVKELINVEKIELTVYEVKLAVGESTMPIVTMLPEDCYDKTEIWESSDDKIASVKKNGDITGVAPGDCQVTVKAAANEDVFATVKVKVVDEILPEQIKLDTTDIKVDVGSTAKITYKVLPDDSKNKNLIWSVSDESIATVKNGTVTGVSEGECKLSVKAEADESVFATATVKVVKPTTTASTTTTASSTTSSAAATTTTSAAPKVEGLTYIQGVLIANKTYALPKNYNPGLTSETNSAFAKMKAAAKEEGLNLFIKSGFRSYATQERLYNGYVKRDGSSESADRYSARPGHSEHQTGLAIDVNKASSSFLGTPEQKWLAKNCYKYGFIIRYPEGKESVTGYKYEPWHVRYLGVDLATKVYNSGLTLEEYLGIDSKYSY